MCASRQQESREDNFLLQEHREIWQFVRKITDERNGWLKFYWSIVGASFAAMGYLYYHFIYGLKSAEPRKLWVIATVVFFTLTLVSIIVLQALHGLRKRSFEYRNKLNIIRAWFLNRNDSEFQAFLCQQKEKDEAKKLQWKYLEMRPDKTFINPLADSGIELWILYLFPAFLSLIMVALIFSIAHIMCPDYRLFSSCYCISVAGAVMLFLLFWVVTVLLIVLFGRGYDKNH